MTDAEFEEFYAATSASLAAYVGSVGGIESVEDIVQSAYLRLFGAKRLPRNPQALRVYLFRIARNLLNDEFRRRSRDGRRSSEVRAREGGPPIEPTAEAPDLDCESRIEVRRAFETLSPRDRELLWLAYVEGLSHREIGEVAGVGAASVRVLLYRARSRLADSLDGRAVGLEDSS